MFISKHCQMSNLSLQISDLSFRRHVLVQALIITDFLLSLSKEEREKRTNINVSNKSVIYPDQLNEENVSLFVYRFLFFCLC